MLSFATSVSFVLDGSIQSICFQYFLFHDVYTTIIFVALGLQWNTLKHTACEENLKRSRGLKVPTNSQ